MKVNETEKPKVPSDATGSQIDANPTTENEQDVDRQEQQADTSAKDEKASKTDTGEGKSHKKSELGKHLKTMRRKMRTTNVLYHAVRNNPRHRDKYYLALIAEVGFENWQYVPSALRMAWESGRTSFDTLYGLIKSFNDNQSVITVFEKAKTEKEEAEAQASNDKKKADILNNLKDNGTSFTTAQLVQITNALLEVLAKAEKKSRQEQNENSYIESIVSAVNQIQKP